MGLECNTVKKVKRKGINLPIVEDETGTVWEPTVTKKVKAKENPHIHITTTYVAAIIKNNLQPLDHKDMKKYGIDTVDERGIYTVVDKSRVNEVKLPTRLKKVGKNLYRTKMGTYNYAYVIAV